MRNLIPHFIQEQYQQQQFEGEFDALTMFVDVSGFTATTQALMKQGHEGAEVLAFILNDVFARMVNTVYEHGGFISVFAGDAFTAMFPLRRELAADDIWARHVLACADHVQAIFRRRGIQTTPYGQFTLQVKVGLSRGKVEWGIVGKTEKAYFFRGAAIDGCAASEHHADKGDIVFDSLAGQLLSPEAIETDVVADGYFRVRKLPQSLLRRIPRLTLPRRCRPSGCSVAKPASATGRLPAR